MLLVGKYCTNTTCENGGRCMEVFTNMTVDTYCSCEVGFTGTSCETGTKNYRPL